MYVLGTYQQVQDYAAGVYAGNASMVSCPITQRWDNVHIYAIEGEYYCAYDPRTFTILEIVATPYPEFQPGKNYRKDGIITFQGGHYIVYQPHTSQADWTPDIAVSLFGQWDVSEYPQWRQPLGEHDAYRVGHRVFHADKYWQCVQGDANGNNVWEPGVFGWVEIEVQL